MNTQLFSRLKLVPAFLRNVTAITHANAVTTVSERCWCIVILIFPVQGWVSLNWQLFPFGFLLGKIGQFGINVFNTNANALDLFFLFLNLSLSCYNNKNEHIIMTRQRTSYKNMFLFTIIVIFSSCLKLSGHYRALCLLLLTIVRRIIHDNTAYSLSYQTCKKVWSI